jgi:pimeloyl-ACP methyl ester carboxylesterase
MCEREMKSFQNHILIVCCLLLGCGRSAPQVTTPRSEGGEIVPEPDDIRSLPGFSSTLVPDPVFGGTIYVLEAGPKNAPPLVLVHGVGAQGSADWYPVLKGFCAHYRVLALDLPGFARSSRSRVAYGPANYVKAIRALTQQRIGRPFFLLGHSMGGAIALLYAGTYPGDVKRLVLADVAGILHRHALAEHVDALVIEGAPTPLKGSIGVVTGAVKQILRNTDISPDRLVSSETGRAAFLNDSPQTIAALSLVAFNFGPATGAVNAPTLLLWGKDDNVAPMRTAKALLSRIKGAALTILEHSAHVPMASEPDAFVHAVHEHLQRVAVTPPPRLNETTSRRRGACKDQAVAHFEGAYDTITIDSCKEVTLNHVTTTALRVNASTVTVDDTTIDGADIGLTATGSHLFMTGGRISGETAIHADGVNLDLAGVHIVGTNRAFSETSSIRLLCSICKVDSPLFHDYVHDIISVVPGVPLEKPTSEQP